MTTTITVEDSTLERFKQLKQELDDVQDAPDHTNETFLKCLMDTYEAVQDGHYGEPDGPLTLSEVDEIAKQLKNEISMANEPGVEVDTESIIKRIDDLENTLPRKVAQEVRQG